MLSVLPYASLIIAVIIQVLVSVIVIQKLVSFNLKRSVNWLRPEFDSIKYSFILLLPYVSFMALRLVTSFVLQVEVADGGEGFILYYSYANLILLGILLLSSIALGVLGIIKSIRNKSLLVIVISILTIISVVSNDSILITSVICLLLFIVHIGGRKKIEAL